MSALTIKKENFQKEILNSDKPVLLDFWASWCGPCRMVSPLVDEIAEEHPEFTVGKVNVDEQPELAAQFHVMSIPSLFVLKNGKIVNQAMGARPKQQILAMMNKYQLFKSPENHTDSSVVSEGFPAQGPAPSAPDALEVLTKTLTVHRR